jgi:Flp pilus assembly pilin Flp
VAGRNRPLRRAHHLQLFGKHILYRFFRSQRRLEPVGLVPRPSGHQSDSIKQDDQMTLLSIFSKDDTGGTTIVYGLITMGIALTISTVVQALGIDVNTSFITLGFR